MKKRFLAFVMTLALLCGAAVPAFAASEGLANFKKTGAYPGYSDVAKTAWYYDGVAAASEYGLMKGGSDGTFNPDGSVTIAESLAMAARLRDIYYGGTGQFTQGEPWYQVYVDYAIENEIIGFDQFRSYTAAAQRKDFASILAAAFPAGALPGLNHVTALPDVDKSEDYAPAVYLLYNAGVLTGSDSQGTFHPGSTITRAEVATIVVRMADPASRRTLTLGTQMSAFEFLTDLAKTMGDAMRSDDGTYYSAKIADQVGLFHNPDGDAYYSELYVDSESDGSLTVKIIDLHPDYTREHPIYYYTTITINPNMTAPYFGVLIFTDGDDRSIGGASIDPAALTEEATVSFVSYEGDSDLKSDLQETYVDGICAALRLLEESCLNPYGYTLKDLGFNALAQ